MFNLLISEVRTFRMRLEGYEERLLRQIRTPLDRDDLEESLRRIVEQEVGAGEREPSCRGPVNITTPALHITLHYMSFS